MAPLPLGMTRDDMALAVRSAAIRLDHERSSRHISRGSRMHPRTQEVLSVLDSYRSALEHAVAQVPASLQRTRPGSEQWSVSEVLEHLSLVEGRIAPMLVTKLAAARAEGLAPETETSRVAPTLDVTRLLDRSNALTASEASRPTAGLSTEAAWNALAEHRRVLRDAIVATDGLALSSVQLPHPRLGDLNIYQWLLFLAGHEGRHTAQIREAAASVQRA